MKVLLVGGGSGGHIFPLIAVQQELVAQNSGIKFVVVSDKMSKEYKGQFTKGTKFYQMQSGKIRRFAHWKWYQYFYPTRFKFYLWNFIDLFKTAFALIKSIHILGKETPDVVFSKGGFISVPIGIIADRRQIPIVLHESDTRPGLAGKLLNKRAVYTAVGMPVANAGKTQRYTGIPVRKQFFKTNKQSARKRLNLSKLNKPILLVTGGSLGARRINEQVIANLEKLIKKYYVILVSGVGEYDSVKEKTKTYSKSDYWLLKFAGEEYVDLIAAADIVVARAGATSIAELAAAGKPTIFIPNSYLTDQVSNAEWLERNDVGIVVDETELITHPEQFTKEVNKLYGKQSQNKYSKAISQIAHPNAAKEVAKLIAKAAG